MKLFPVLAAAFLTRVDKKSLSGPLGTTKREAEECFTLAVRRRLLERYINNKRYLPLTPPNLQPGDTVKQKSVLLDPSTENEVGYVYTMANVLDEDVRLAHGAYNITAGDRTGLINFSALISNDAVTDTFDVAITSGTGMFHSAQGYIILSPWNETNGFLERDATLRICGLYE
jgi:hypothetical protein